MLQKLGLYQYVPRVCKVPKQTVDETNGTVNFRFVRTLVYDRIESFVKSLLSGVGLAF